MCAGVHVSVHLSQLFPAGGLGNDEDPLTADRQRAASGGRRGQAFRRRRRLPPPSPLLAPSRLTPVNHVAVVQVSFSGKFLGGLWAGPPSG